MNGSITQWVGILIVGQRAAPHLLGSVISYTLCLCLHSLYWLMAVWRFVHQTYQCLSPCALLKAEKLSSAALGVPKKNQKQSSLKLT